MMQITWGSWTGVLIWLVGLALSAAIILGLGSGALWIVKRMIGEKNFPALTMLVAVVGALVAITQATSNGRETKDRQARTLVFATDIATKMMFLEVSGDTGAGDNRTMTAIPPNLLRLKAARFDATAKALADIDIKDMPSAMSMSALVRARAAANSAVLHAVQGMQQNQAVDFDRDVAEMGNAISQFQAETDRLYPIYKLGPLAIGKMPQQR